MPLRLFRGRINPGREDDFITLLREGVEREAPAPGLQSYMAGYRRVDGVEKYILASAWQTEADLRRSVGDDPLGNPNTLAKIDGIATAERIDHYELVLPQPSGLLDAPGAVLRASRANVRPGKFEQLVDFLVRKNREINGSQLTLGWMVGWREREGRIEMAGVSAWASPLQYEAISNAGLGNPMLFTELEDYVTDYELEVYQAIELQLSPRLQALGGRRLIVARFDSPRAAAAAQLGLEFHAPPLAAQVSVASMAASGARDTQVFVARVELAHFARAERLIADHGGQIVYEADEAAPY